MQRGGGDRARPEFAGGDAHPSPPWTAGIANEVVAQALELGAESVQPWSEAERRLATAARRPSGQRLDPAVLRERIRAGEDPLGAAVMAVPPDLRRSSGVTYTPGPIVESMVRWAGRWGAPARVVDAGCGSGRFIVSAGRVFPEAALLAIDLDPLACILTKASLAAAGMAARSHVLHQDYREPLPRHQGSTLFIGNPPYVRHHDLGQRSKRWLTETARRHGRKASQLAGLHVHFFLATLEHSSPGDYGVFVTSAEWLDVNYGALVRGLLLDRMGAVSIHIVEPEAQPFEGTATTAAITGFRIDHKPSTVRLRRVQAVDELGSLEGGVAISAERLAETSRWTSLTRPAAAIPAGFVELGELCRVHRGAVTGSNSVWVAAAADAALPAAVLFAAVTRARELFAAGGSLTSLEGLKVVIDLPADLDALALRDRRQVERFLRLAEAHGAAEGYIARHRKPWWSIRLRAPAPILATYMARRPPAFVRNIAAARHINIAHGLYPRQELPGKALDRLAAALRSAVTQAQGRTYAGGLTKFEPKEMERLPVPDLPLLIAP